MKRDKKTGRFINAKTNKNRTSVKQISSVSPIRPHTKQQVKHTPRREAKKRPITSIPRPHKEVQGLPSKAKRTIVAKLESTKKKGKIINAKTRNDNPISINKNVPKSGILSAIKKKVKRNARIGGYRKPTGVVSGSDVRKRVSPKQQRVVPGNKDKLNKSLLKQITELKAELSKLKKSAASTRRPFPIYRKPLGPQHPAKRETPKAKKPKAKKPIGKGQRVKGGGKKPVRRLARFDRLGKPIPRKLEFETLYKGSYSEELKGYFVTIKADVGVGWATESTPVFDEDDGETYHRVVWRTKVQASKKEAFTAYFALLGDQSNMSDIQGVPFLLRGGELCELFSDLSVHVIEKWGKKGPK